MIVNQQLQAQSGWKFHTQADGSNIGGVPPTSYGMLQRFAGQPTAALFYVNGVAYADWEAYIETSLLPTTGNLQLDFDLTVDGNAAAHAQALETDTILCIGGWNYNLSLQLNYAENGQLQIANESGGWVNIGSGPGKLVPHMPHHYTLTYAFSEARLTSSVAGIVIDGVEYAVPTALQNVPAKNEKWTDGAIFQVQQDLNGAGGGFTMVVDNAQYSWW